MAVLNDYLDHHLKGKAGYANGKLAVSHLERHFAMMTVAQVNQDEADLYIAARFMPKKYPVDPDIPISVETKRRELSVLNAGLKRAERKGIIERAPFIKLPPKPPGRERYLTRSEAARLLRQCRTPHLRMFVRLGLYTGARPTAIFELTWDRVDLENGFVDYGHGTGNKRRGIKPVDGALLAALRRSKTKSGPVVAWKGAAIKSIKNAYRKAVARAKLPGEVVRYTLRHSMATLAAMNGADLHAIGGMLDHTDPRQTQRYAKYSPNYLRQVSKAVLRGKRQ